jgi:hypothetical protein
MLEEYLAETIAQERRRARAADALAREALTHFPSPNAFNWLVRWAVEPYSRPSRARKARSTSGHSSWTME